MQCMRSCRFIKRQALKLAHTVHAIRCVENVKYLAPLYIGATAILRTRYTMNATQQILRSAIYEYDER